MPKFITDLQAKIIDDATNEYRGLWQLLAPLVYKSDVAKRLIVVPSGFVSDFESCPRVPVAFYLFGAMADRAAVIHDYLYSTREVPRALADAVLKEACIASGIPAWRAWGIWAGVRLGGGSHYGEKV